MTAAASAASAAAAPTSHGQRLGAAAAARDAICSGDDILTVFDILTSAEPFVLKRASAWIEGFAIGLGAPGLLLLAFVDSSVLSLPQVVEVLIVWMVLAHPDRWLVYGGLAAAGSVVGLYVLYALARRGGEAFLRRRLHARHVDRAMAAFQRYGVATLILPSLVPVPVPVKPFVLMAGVAGMPRRRFLAAVASGRAVRFVGLALLTRWYGEAALDYLRANALFVTLVAGAVVAAGLAAYAVYRMLRATR